MFTSVVFVLALVGSSFAGIVDFKPCKGNLNPPQVVQIDGCESSRCVLNLRSTVNIQVEFVAPVDASSVEADFIVGTKSKVTQACSNGLKCPLVAGEYYIHKDSFYIEQQLIQESLTYNLKSNGQTLACFTYPIVVE